MKVASPHRCREASSVWALALIVALDLFHITDSELEKWMACCGGGHDWWHPGSIFRSPVAALGDCSLAKTLTACKLPQLGSREQKNHEIKGHARIWMASSPGSASFAFLCHDA